MTSQQLSPGRFDWFITINPPFTVLYFDVDQCEPLLIHSQARRKYTSHTFKRTFDHHPILRKGDVEELSERWTSELGMCWVSSHRVDLGKYTGTLEITLLSLSHHRIIRNNSALIQQRKHLFLLDKWRRNVRLRLRDGGREARTEARDPSVGGGGAPSFLTPCSLRLYA